MKLAAAIFSLTAAAAFAQTAELRPFEIIWNPDGAVQADMSFLLDAPAGKDGPLQVRGGHLVKPNGQRVRLWGVNMSFVGSMPSKELAPAVAAHLARFGVNCVRVHHLDWRVPRGIIDSKFPDSRHLDPDRLDRLDFFISELKKRGIYVNLNLNVARAFQDADGVKDASKLGFAKTVTLFDRRIIELEKDYARQLLGHRNPYTGAEYRGEPAVAIVEVVNENSVIESWKTGRLVGKGPAPGQMDLTWTDIPESYAKDLDRMYAEYLKKQPGSPDWPRLKPSEFAQADARRFETEASFYMDLERRFFAEMYDYLKKDLGVKAPVIGTSIHNGGISGYPLLTSTAPLDIVDTHTYWQHPRYGTDPATGRRTFQILNTPMVNQPDKSTVVMLNRAAVAGKPFTASEVNHPYPAEYAAEGIPVLAAYALFQDWDGIFWYSFSHNAAEDWKSSYPNHFDIRQDPVKMSQLASAGAMFLRGDVAAAKKVFVRNYSAEEVRESLRLPPAEAPNFTPGMPHDLALRTGSRIGSLDAKPTKNWPRDSGPIVSDTKELRWLLNDGKGLVTVDTARTQALIGFTKSNKAELKHLGAALTNEFAALLLTSLDTKPIANADRLLLTAGARTGNTGMKWNEGRTTLLETGTGPVTIETVQGTVALRGLAGAHRVDVYPLDGAGRRLGPVTAAKKNLDSWVFPIGEEVTTWYLVVVVH